jgi:hypothetical protein
MIMYNKKRSAEWVAAQKKLEADSLDAARIAYMLGKANEEQMALVEEQLERERQEGRKTSFFSDMPSVLGAPEPSSSVTTTTQTPQSVTETVSWPAKSTPSTTTATDTTQPPQAEAPKAGLWTWLTSNLKREEEGDRRLGYESLSEEDDAAGGVRDSDIVRAVEEKQAYLKAKAAAAVDKEKATQREGGPLDRVGIPGPDTGVGAGAGGAAAVAESGGEGEVKGAEKKKGWFW